MAVASTLTRYRPLSKIATGGMATITLAEDTVLGRPVALKRLSGSVSGNGISRLRREALVGASVSHPNLVSIYDVVAEDDDVVIVMEYVEGHTLKDAVAQEGRLAPQEALRILRGVASALDAIHARGIVHRDVKPPNILLGHHGEVKLADLGIAAAPDRTSITTEGSVLGSFSYMAPEQLEAAPASPAMDIYALSAVAFEALGGRRARQENNPMALAHAVATQPPPDLSSVWPEAPPAVSELLKRGMARDPAERPSSAGNLVRSLQSALGPGLEAGGAAAAVSSAPPTPRPRPQRARTARPAAPRPAQAPGRPAADRRPAAAAGAGLAAGASLAAGAADTRPPGGDAADIRPPSGDAADTRAGSRPDRHDSGPPGARSRRGGWLVPLLIGLVVLAVVVTVLSSGGNSRRTAGTRSTPRHAAATGRAKPKTHGHARGKPAPPSTPAGQTNSAPPSAGAGGGAAPGSAATGNGTPVGAVEGFYEDAAAHRFSSAWALADPNFRNQLQGYDSFVAGQQGDRRIIFRSARVSNQTPGASTVAVQTTSIRADGTQHCAGTVDLVPGGGGWLLHEIHINC